MDDDESRKLILRLQMEDLASIWASSTTSTDDGAELDADVSLRLYRQELRAAEQQIEDEHSAQATAQNEHRQRDAILADREAARRLFLELNPNEPLPQFVGNEQLAIDESSTSDNALNPEVSSAPDLNHSTDQSSIPLGPSSLLSQRTSLTSTGIKRSANHLDTDDETSTKKQASDGTVSASGQFSARSLLFAQRAGPRSIRSTLANPFGSVQAPTSSLSTPTGLKRPAPDDFDDGPPAKRLHSTPKDSSLVWEIPRSTAGQQLVSAVSDTNASSQTGHSSFIGSFGRPSQNVTEAPGFGQTAGPRLGSGSRFLFSSRANKRGNRHADSDNQEPQVVPASRQPAAARQPSAVEPDQYPEVECIVCCKKVSRTKSHSHSCGHSYCSKCINKLFKMAVRDDSMWPPQCCKAVTPIEDIEHLLHEDLIPLVKAKQVEMNVPILDRIYCVTCSAFIPQEHIHETNATCHGCSSSTCTKCKEKAHVGDCQNNFEQDTKDLEALAEQKGWKKCSTCLMFVERRFGCNHMTCRCKNEFCYLCAEKWKDCKCPWWIEEALLEREAQRGVAPVPLEACRHETWQWYPTRDHCDHCGDLLFKFLFRCSGCLLHYCRWCTFNRGLTLA